MLNKLLIALDDEDYAEFLSDVLLENHSQEFEVAVESSCNPLKLQEILDSGNYDVALLSLKFVSSVKFDAVKLPLFLNGHLEKIPADMNYRCISKYQRISVIVRKIYENLAEVAPEHSNLDSGTTQITAVWSPAGGVGKTTIALAAAKKIALQGKKVIYLNLENFCSTHIYFNTNNGKSISEIFPKLEQNIDVNLMRSVRCEAEGVSYFNKVENFEEMNELTADEILNLISFCRISPDEEVIVDLSSQCDEKMKKIFDVATKILLVCNNSDSAKEKLKQFVEQSNVFEKIKAKVVLINNKGGGANEPKISKTVSLPRVNANNENEIINKLATNSNLNW